jgi:hypothetical protein
MIDPPEKQTDFISIVLFKSQFKEPDVFEDILKALGKDLSETTVIITINK